MGLGTGRLQKHDRNCMDPSAGKGNPPQEDKPSGSETDTELAREANHDAQSGFGSGINLDVSEVAKGSKAHLR
jgi:hypothetical protein